MAAAGAEFFRQNPDGHAGRAAQAIRPVGEPAGAAKSRLGKVVVAFARIGPGKIHGNAAFNLAIEIGAGEQRRAENKRLASRQGNFRVEGVGVFVHRS